MSVATLLRGRSSEVLRGNDTGSYTLPSRSTYPHQWNWDSALAALGWAELDPGRAWTELETLAGARDPGGMLPHIAFQRRLRVLSVRYVPGARWWGRRVGADGRRISGITQLPVAASCLRLLFEAHPDERRARGLLEPLLAWHRFLLAERDPHGTGEPVLIHPWESGRDNAVEWDAPLWRVMPEVNEGAFRVLAPGFSAILARACHDLGAVADALGESRVADESRRASERVSAALRARADSDGLIRALDLTDGSALTVTSAGSALALLAPGLHDKEVAAGRVAVLDGALSSRWGVRSLEAAHPERAARNYWRGPVWANITWLTALGLELHGEQRAAQTLRDRMMLAIEGSGMREYFAPESGRGLGARDFAWTAALCLREAGAT